MATSAILNYRLVEGDDKFNRPLYRKNYFVGQCFFCGSFRHTQAYCPLQKCNNCHIYGHNIRVCKRRPRYSNYIYHDVKIK